MPKVIYEHSGPPDVLGNDYVDGMAAMIEDDVFASDYNAAAGGAGAGAPAIAWPPEFEPSRAGSRPA